MLLQRQTALSSGTSGKIRVIFSKVSPVSVSFLRVIILRKTGVLRQEEYERLYAAESFPLFVLVRRRERSGVALLKRRREGVNVILISENTPLALCRETQLCFEVEKGSLLFILFYLLQVDTIDGTKRRTAHFYFVPLYQKSKMQAPPFCGL